MKSHNIANLDVIKGLFNDGSRSTKIVNNPQLFRLAIGQPEEYSDEVWLVTKVKKETNKR